MLCCVVWSIGIETCPIKFPPLTVQNGGVGNLIAQLAISKYRFTNDKKQTSFVRERRCSVRHMCCVTG